MKKFTFYLLLTISVFSYSQNSSDSIVLFSNLKYHSTFEKESIYQFSKNKKDTFNLFCSIDETINRDDANNFRFVFYNALDELKKQKPENKNNEQKVKIIYNFIHNRFLKIYSENTYFPDIFRTGSYNCVSATILYSLGFNYFSVPYKIMSSKDHIYLIAFPGKNSIVIETTNPNFENGVFSGSYKQQYVSNLKLSKQISEDDLKNRSVEEIFAAKFNNLKENLFTNLPGFQYHNKTISFVQNNNFDKTYEYCLKSFFFYPDASEKNLFLASLAFKLDKSEFNKPEDIDLIGQFIRYDTTNVNEIRQLFDMMLSKNLQYTDRAQNVKTYYERLISQISNKDIINELTFNYNLKMAYNERNETNNMLLYALKALKCKPNHKDAISLYKNCIEMKLNIFSEKQEYANFLDSLDYYLSFVKNPELDKEFKDMRITAYLKAADFYFQKQKPFEGEKYVNLFESLCSSDQTNSGLKVDIEHAYYEFGRYYAKKKDKIRMENAIKRGLKYVNKSNYIQCARDEYPVKVNLKMKIAK